jgi:hypothetical protein
VGTDLAFALREMTVRAEDLIALRSGEHVREQCCATVRVEASPMFGSVIVNVVELEELVLSLLTTGTDTTKKFDYESTLPMVMGESLRVSRRH